MQRFWHILGTIVGLGGTVLPSIEGVAAHIPSPGLRTAVALVGAGVALATSLQRALGRSSSTAAPGLCSGAEPITKVERRP